MTRQLATPEPLYVRLGDAFVILSATLLSLASGAWLIARLGLDLSTAIMAALGTYCTLLLLHLLARRLLRADEPDDATDAGDADEGDLHWQSGAAAFEAALARHAAPDADDASSPGVEETPATRTGPDAWPQPLPFPAADEAEAAFRFRPSRIPYFERGEDTEPAAPASEKREAEGGVPPAELNVEVIQDLIKKLADELNGPPGRDTGADGLAPEAARAPEASIGRSVAALDVAARAMRSPSAGGAIGPPADAGSGVPDWWPTALPGSREGGPPAFDPQLVRIAEAIDAERFEVLIEPIHALDEGRPRHYEVSMRLLTADGGAIEQADYMRTAQSSELLPHIDAARMLRAARVARRLAERGRQGSVLSAMAGDSITDNSFLDAIVHEQGNDGGIQLVLSFSQSDARTFTPAHAEALGTMAGSGFGFALEDVTDLEMDFGRLKAIGFEFVKLDAQVFLDGLQAPGGCVPAADICRYLSEFGLALIVGSIEDDWQLAKMMGFGVLLGKGTLFGGPRLVKPEAVAGPAAA